MEIDEIVRALMAKGVRQEALADELGVSQGTVSRWLSGAEPKGMKLIKLHEIAARHGVLPSPPVPSVQISSLPEAPLPPSNARIGPKVYLGETGERIPVYGQAVGGDDGRFILNGNRVGDVLMPPVLYGVPDAYAVYVSGDSMEPRYEAGEVVYVHPYLPVRRDDYVVVQIALDEHEPPAGYIKRFVSMSGDTLRLRQFNPAKDMHFPRARVVSVHKIVGSGI